MKDSNGGRIQSRGRRLRAAVLQSSEGCTLRANPRAGERLRRVVRLAAGSRPEPPPHENGFPRGGRMHAVPLDLVFALTPLLVLGLLQFLDD
jgi:hypothetical protein